MSSNASFYRQALLVKNQLRRHILQPVAARLVIQRSATDARRALYAGLQQGMLHIELPLGPAFVMKGHIGQASIKGKAVGREHAVHLLQRHAHPGVRYKKGRIEILNGHGSPDRGSAKELSAKGVDDYATTFVLLPFTTAEYTPGKAACVKSTFRKCKVSADTRSSPSMLAKAASRAFARRLG